MQGWDGLRRGAGASLSTGDLAAAYEQVLAACHIVVTLACAPFMHLQDHGTTLGVPTQMQAAQQSLQGVGSLGPMYHPDRGSGYLADLAGNQVGWVVVLHALLTID